MNLFLALLLSSFGASNLSAAGGTDNDANKLTEAFNRIGRLRRWIKKWSGRFAACISQTCLECCRHQISARRGKNEDSKSRIILQFTNSLSSIMYDTYTY